METSKFIIFGIYAAVLAFVLYRMARKNPMKEEYDRLYNDILTSKKYKVKGQFEREE